MKKAIDVLIVAGIAALLNQPLRMMAMSETAPDFFGQLPGTIGDWRKAEKPAVYTPNDLFGYIDGGAELYISYNFRNALSLKYTKGEDNEITVDIFDMGSSFDAFGVFAHTRETIDARFGQGSEYAAGLLTFWKDRYYVSILAYPETEEKKRVVFDLGRAIAAAIKDEGPLPPILSLLPAENLVPESVHFFHHYIWLNSFYFISNENVLNITPGTPAVLAKYRAGGGTLFLLLVRYPGESQAGAAQTRFQDWILAGSPEGIRKMDDGRFAGCRRLGSLLAAVFGAPDEAALRSMLGRVRDR
jgi:hypothetical protein